MIGTQTIVPQATQQGIFQGLPCAVPPGAARVLVQAVMNSGDITTIGVVLGVQAIASPNFGATWQPCAAIPEWYSGPQTWLDRPGGPYPASAPGVSVPVWPNMTHYSGLLTLISLSDVGLALTFFDASGKTL